MDTKFLQDEWAILLRRLRVEHALVVVNGNGIAIGRWVGGCGKLAVIWATSASVGVGELIVFWGEFKVYVDKRVISESGMIKGERVGWCFVDVLVWAPMVYTGCPGDGGLSDSISSGVTRWNSSSQFSESSNLDAVRFLWNNRVNSWIVWADFQVAVKFRRDLRRLNASLDCGVSLFVDVVWWTSTETCEGARNADPKDYCLVRARQTRVHSLTRISWSIKLQIYQICYIHTKTS